MKITDLRTYDDALADHLADPEQRAEWDRSAFAREVAVHLVRYRSEHGLTQAQLARSVGMKQPVVARLERGESPPSLATLARITAGTGIEFHIDISHGSVALSA